MNNPPPVPFGDPTQVEHDNKAAIKKGVLFGCGGCAVVIAAGLVLVTAIVMIVFTSMSGSDVCTQALARARASAQVRSALGQPIEKGWWVTGSINTSNSTGDADITFPIKGPQAGGEVHAKATKVNGAWKFTILSVTLPDGRVVDLLVNETAVRLQSRQQLFMHAIEAAIAENDNHIAAACA